MATFIHRLGMILCLLPLYVITAVLYACAAPFAAALDMAQVYRKHW